MDQFEPELTNPQRKLEDILGLLLFAAVTVTWIGVGIFAHLKGDIQSLLHPKDSYGQRCGIDYLVQHKPYLYYIDITKCDDVAVPVIGCDANTVCVEECPKEMFLSSKEFDTESKPLICTKGSVNWNINDCASWYLPSSSYNGRCVPRSVPDEETLIEISNIEERSIDAGKMKRAIQNVKLSSDLISGARYFMNDVVGHWWAFIAATFLILFISGGYYLIFSAYPKAVFICSIVLVPLALGISLYFGYSRYSFHKDDESDFQYEFIHKKRNIWLGFLIFLGIAALFLVFMTLFWIRETFKGILLIKMCIGNLKDRFGILFVATNCWVLQIIILIFFVSSFLHLGNINEPVNFNISMDKFCAEYLSSFNKDVNILACDPDFVSVRNHDLCANISCQIIARKSEDYLFLRFVNVVSYVWMTLFLLAIEELTIGLFVYRSYQVAKDDISEHLFSNIFQDFSLVFRYHIGTAFFGSMLIALFKYVFLRLLLVWTAKKSNSSDAISKINCCLGLCSIIEKIYGFIDTQVLVVSIIFNKSFLAGSKLYRKLSNNEYVSQIKPVGSIYYIVFYQKLLITLFCTFLSFFYVKYLEPGGHSMAYSFLIVLFIFYLTFTTASFIYSVYTIMIDAIVICLLKDLNENVPIAKDNLRFELIKE